MGGVADGVCGGPWLTGRRDLANQSSLVQMEEDGEDEGARISTLIVRPGHGALTQGWFDANGKPQMEQARRPGRNGGQGRGWPERRLSASAWGFERTRANYLGASHGLLQILAISTAGEGWQV